MSTEIADGILFQSTLLVRGATENQKASLEKQIISIHAPRERSDSFCKKICGCILPFQSTLLVRGATSTLLSDIQVAVISIHAPRERSDTR